MTPPLETGQYSFRTRLLDESREVNALSSQARGPIAHIFFQGGSRSSNYLFYRYKFFTIYFACFFCHFLFNLSIFHLFRLVIHQHYQAQSLPSRERGLKQFRHNRCPIKEQSLPSRERGLKLHRSNRMPSMFMSLPSRERGLKHLHWPSRHPA